VRRHFVDDLRTLGFREIHELKTGEANCLCGFRITLYIDESYSNEDSGIFVEADGCSFLNMNDCRAYDTIDPVALQPVDLFTIQFSRASWYPRVYDYGSTEKNAIAGRKN